MIENIVKENIKECNKLIKIAIAEIHFANIALDSEKNLVDSVTGHINLWKSEYKINKKILQEFNLWNSEYDKHYADAIKGKLNYDKLSELNKN